MANRIERSVGLHPSAETMSAGGSVRIAAEANRVGEGVNKAFSDHPLLNGRVVSGLQVGTVSQAFAHGLKGTPRGWFIVDKGGDANVWRTNWSDRTINLVASASVTIAIYVYL